MSRRSLWIYLALTVAWLAVIGWQAAEHLRVRETTQTQVVNRARDISSTMALVMRSQRRFGVISRERLESAIQELIRPGEVDAIALVNTDGEIVAAAGEEEIALSGSEAARAGVHWGSDTVTVVDLVDLGTNFSQEATAPPPTIVLPREQLYGTNSPPPRPPPSGDPNFGGGTNTSRTNLSPFGFRGRPPRGGTNTSSTNSPSFSRPFWMSKQEYETAVKKAGAHSIVIMLSAGFFREVVLRDLWLRGGIGLLTAAAVGLFGFAWRNFGKTHDLQLRLVKASEMNTHLKEMNLAAAGLAHETRNPLNIIRGLAQMISKQTQAPAEVREKSSAILEETDRVTAQLNEFINYSRPREVRRSPVAVGHVMADVARALAFDVEEKKVQLTVPTEDLVIEADEQLLRQALFNLLLNAVQAVEAGGEIRMLVQRQDGPVASLEVRDNGPGVPPEQRAEIFKPYFTTHKKGTGLGLAVVQQIVSAHGWDIECLDNPPRGAVFRINHVKTVSKT